MGRGLRRWPGAGQPPSQDPDYEEGPNRQEGCGEGDCGGTAPGLVNRVFDESCHAVLFAEREPQFAPLFQLPPKIAALIPDRPLLFLPLDPHVQHAPDFLDQSLGEFELAMAHAALGVKKPHPKPQMRKTRIGGIQF